MPTFDNVLVTGSQTIGQDLQVNGNQTIGQHLNVNSNQTISGSLQVNNSETIQNHLSVGGAIDSGDSVRAVHQLAALNRPTLPGGAMTLQQIRYYNPGVLNQPGLVLTGTDGLTYILFIDVSSGTPSLAIQRA